MKEKLLVIVGPTAVGKTELSIEIAKRFNGEIISGDSMQIYKGMDIGTAKISLNEMKGIPHYLVDNFVIDYNFSVAEFQEIAINEISQINKRNKLPIIVGGTGLYIKSVTHKYDFPSAQSDVKYRKYLNQLLEREGKEFLYNKLRMEDPLSADKIHINDTKRVIRALEIYHKTGKPMSNMIYNQQLETPYDLLMIGLTMERKKLYEKINNRVDIMIEKGLVDEVSGLLDKGYDEAYSSMQGIGYKEIVQHLKGEITLEEAIELIKLRTRRFAKRQLSWFRAMSEVNWFDMTVDLQEERNEIYNNIYKLIAGKYQINEE